MIQGSGSVGQKGKLRVLFIFIALLENVLHSLDHSLSKPIGLGVQRGASNVLYSIDAHKVLEFCRAVLRSIVGHQLRRDAVFCKDAL